MGLSVFYQASEAFTAIHMWIKADKNSIIKVTGTLVMNLLSIFVLYFILLIFQGK